MDSGEKPPPKKKKNRRPRKGGRRGGPPPAPQSKLMIRGIIDHPKVETIVNAVSDILRLANDKLGADCRVHIDQESLDAAIQKAEASEAAQLKWEKSLETNQQEGEQTENHTEADEGESDEKAVEEVTKGINNLSTTSNKIPADAAVVARLLYVVATKQTKRRGEKPGYAYILLWTRSIVPKNPPSAAAEVGESTDVEAKPRLPDYSEEVGQRRRSLLRATEALENIMGGSKNKPWTNWKLLEAPNPKPFRLMKPDKLEGTVFETPAYKDYLESQNASQEAIEKRPRPAPGGGALSMQTGGDASSEQRVSQLVKNLQARKEQEKQKKAKRKKKEAAKKAANKSSRRKKKKAPPSAVLPPKAG